MLLSATQIGHRSALENGTTDVAGSFTALARTG